MVRKSIRIKSYDYKSNGYYFVTLCTHFRQPYLYNENVKKIVVAELARLSERFKGVSIDYYSIMSNHVHMILCLENSKCSLPRVIQALKSLTTLKAKQALPLQIGKFLWQRNYYEHIIRNEKALYEIRKYIQENPEEERLNLERIYERINSISKASFATTKNQCSSS